jgi:hypothetical protein
MMESIEVGEHVKVEGLMRERGQVCQFSSRFAMSHEWTQKGRDL